MARYSPSGKVGGVGLVLLLALGLAGGALAGGLFHFVGRFFYLVLLFPLAWGLGVGAAVAAGVRAGKCRSAGLAAAVGLISSFASYGLYQVLDNQQVRSAFREYWAKEVKVDPSDAGFRAQCDEAYEKMLVKQHGSSGFFSELSVRAEMGMSITRSRSSRGKDSKPMITGTGMYVYWVIELAIIAGIGLLLPVGAAREPFCERCEAWYEKTDLAGIAGPKVGAARRALETKQYASVTPCVSRDRSDGILSLEKCPKGCDGIVRVKLDSVSRDQKGKESRTTVFEDMVAAKEASAIEGAAAGPAVPPPAGFTGAGPKGI